jgi:2-succinyl-5-enolpyruvyl-6-hydroxy-3-cyclohexene-1-carboxylate synthase
MSGVESADTQAAFCAVLCDEWVRAGVTDAVVSPGSRSTPLVTALDAEPRIRVTVVLDERSAGFIALGLGLANGRPAVVVTTSGTASVELHPAVVEAALACVPMIAVTTDRPPELHHVGAAQTIEQQGLFGRSVRWMCDPGVAALEVRPMWRSLGARSAAEAVAGPSGPGPVHLNLPFREPLLGRPDGVERPAGRAGDAPWHQVAVGEPGPPPAEVVDRLLEHAGARGLIVAGEGAGGDVVGLAERLGWPVLADPRSGCRVPSRWVVSCADALLRTAAFSELVPDVVLRIGAPWASKVLNQWLAGLPADRPQILADRWGRWADPDRRGSIAARTTAASLARALDGCRADPEANDWILRWTRGEAAARSAIDRLLRPDGLLDLSEPAIAWSALCNLPADGALVASSSMPVRDIEWYGPPVAGVRVLSNRGVNGIDGVISTCLGVALAEPARPTVGLVGDLAFVYDAGALLWASGRPTRLRLVVVDNDGGGIFSFLPQAQAFSSERFERYWGTPHGLDLVAVAEAYGVRAERIADRAGLDRFVASPGAPGIEVAVVPSDRAANVAAHDRIHEEVALAVA